MNPLVLLSRAKFLINSNSVTILTGVGVAGTAGTAYLTGRGTVKAVRAIDEKYKELEEAVVYKTRNDEPIVYELPHLSKIDTVKLVWWFYVPAITVGVSTISAIILANRISAKQIAALTVASGITERAFSEYKEKVVEKLGEKQHTKIRDEVAQDRVKKNPPNTSELIVTGDNKVLCMDGLTGRYFQSTIEDMKRAENEINSRMINQTDASLSEFYDEIGLSSTTYSDTVGWNSARLVTLEFSSTMTPDDRPCIVVDFNPHPFPTYSKFHE